MSTKQYIVKPHILFDLQAGWEIIDTKNGKIVNCHHDKTDALSECKLLNDKTK
jgi:hypothetical protein